MDLETILQNFNYKRVFKKNGSLSVSGAKAYGKLIDLIYNLSAISAITSKQAEAIVRKIDTICEEDY